MEPLRELSPKEIAFLEEIAPGAQATMVDSNPDGPKSRRTTRWRRSRVSRTALGLLSYLPLAIGVITLLTAGFAGYIYIWGRDFFKVSELERLSKDGSLALMDSTSSGWFLDILNFFTLAPWLIFGAIVVGAALMGLSMVIVRKRKNG